MKDWRTIAEDVPAQALPLMAQQLSEYGAEVEFTGNGQGMITSIAGTLAFRLQAGRFDVKLLGTAGHFSEAILLGGARQFVQEAVERLKRVEA